MFTVFLKEASTEPLVQVGSKALHLANIFHEGVTIPNGFVLKANALNQFMKDSHLHNEMPKNYKSHRICKRVEQCLSYSYLST